MDKKRIPRPIKNLGREYFKVISTLVVNAFSLVAALAWNDLIKKIIERYISPGSSLVSQLIYVIIITTLIVLVTIEVGKLSQKFKDEEEGEK